MNDLFWYVFYALGAQYAQSANDDPECFLPETIRAVVREHVAAHDLLEDSLDVQELHAAFALGVNDTLDDPPLP